MRDTGRIITESFADMGTVVMDDVPYAPPRHAPTRADSCWYGRLAPQLSYATPGRRALHERVLCVALAVLNPQNRRR